MPSVLMTDIIADKEKQESQYCSKETEKGFTVCISRIEGHKSKLQYCHREMCRHFDRRHQHHSRNNHVLNIQ
jgi:hypothetical protein